MQDTTWVGVEVWCTLLEARSIESKAPFSEDFFRLFQVLALLVVGERRGYCSVTVGDPVSAFSFCPSSCKLLMLPSSVGRVVYPAGQHAGGSACNSYFSIAAGRVSSAPTAGQISLLLGAVVLVVSFFVKR